MAIPLTSKGRCAKNLSAPTTKSVTGWLSSQQYMEFPWAGKGLVILWPVNPLLYAAFANPRFTAPTTASNDALTMLV